MAKVFLEETLFLRIGQTACFFLTLTMEKPFRLSTRWLLLNLKGLASYPYVRRGGLFNKRNEQNQDLFYVLL